MGKTKATTCDYCGAMTGDTTKWSKMTTKVVTEGKYGKSSLDVCPLCIAEVMDNAKIQALVASEL